MKILLLEKINKLGACGDLVEVANGFARNFLIPKEKAVIANKENLTIFKEKRKEIDIKAKAKLQGAKYRANSLENVILNIKHEATTDGLLYGSVSTKQIVDAVKLLDIDITKQEVKLPVNGIRRIGEHDIRLVLHSDVIVNIKLNIINS